MAVAVAACASVVALSAPASAEPGDAPSAILTTVSDIAAATLANSVQDPNDNISCDPPKVGGGVVNQRTGYFVGELYGNDVGFGQITCMRIDGGTFTLQGQAIVQAFSAGRWNDVRSGLVTARPSIGGASTVAPTVTGAYGSFDSSLNKYHRTKAVFKTSTGRVYTMYSTPWYMSA